MIVHFTILVYFFYWVWRNYDILMVKDTFILGIKMERFTKYNAL